MSSKRGFGEYRISADDLWQSVAEWSNEHDVRFYHIIGTAVGTRAGTYVEVVVCRAGYHNFQGEVVRLRRPLTAKNPLAWPGEMLRATFEAIEELERNPWLWSLERVRDITRE